MNLNDELDRIIAFINEGDKSANDVSEKSAYWHIEHALQVMLKVCGSLSKSDPNRYRNRFNSKAIYLFTVGRIPRGKGKAPKGVIPQGEISQDELLKRAQKIKILLNQLDSLPSKSYIVHPTYGRLKLNKSIRFLRIHTAHHLLILDDILEKNTSKVDAVAFC